MKFEFPSDTLGNRLRWLREKHDLTLDQFGHLINFGRSYLSKLENGKKVKVSRFFLISLCSVFGLRMEWLDKGEGDPFLLESVNIAAMRGALPAPPLLETLKNEGVFLAANYVSGAILSLNRRTGDIVNALLVLLEKRAYSDPVRLEVARILLTEVDGRLNSRHGVKVPDDVIVSALGEGALAAVELADCDFRPEFDGKITANSQLTKLTDFDNILGVKAKLPTLLKRLNEATKERGLKTALAKFMGVPLSNISQWLAGEREPSGETTLKLLHWVEQQERQK